MAGLLSAVAADLGLEGPARVVGLDLPAGVGVAPTEGIDGIRRTLGVYGRPLTLLDLGRSGLQTPDEVAQAVLGGVERGIDIFHDAVFGPESGVLERVRAVDVGPWTRSSATRDARCCTPCASGAGRIAWWTVPACCSPPAPTR